MSRANQILEDTKSTNEEDSGPVDQLDLKRLATELSSLVKKELNVNTKFTIGERYRYPFYVFSEEIKLPINIFESLKLVTFNISWIEKSQVWWMTLNYNFEYKRGSNGAEALEMWINPDGTIKEYKSKV